MVITTEYDSQIVKKKRSLLYRLFRLFHRGPLWDDLDRVIDLQRNDPSDIIIVSVDEHNDL